MDKFKIEQTTFEAALAEHVNGYEYYGEDENERDTCYTPTERERLLMADAIRGWDPPADGNAKAADRACLEMIERGYYWNDDAWVRGEAKSDSATTAQRLQHDIDWIIKHLDAPERAARGKHRGFQAIKHVAGSLRRKLEVVGGGEVVEAKARSMFEAQADKNAAPWDNQWEGTKNYWRAEASAAIASDLSVNPRPSDRDAYEGAREDLLDWKGRAQRAEAALRSLGYKGADASEPGGVGEVVEVVEYYAGFTEAFVGKSQVAGTTTPSDQIALLGLIASARAAVAHQSRPADVTVTRDEDGEIILVTQGDQVIASTCHAGGKQPQPEYSQRALGIACTVAWTELVQALRADGHEVGDSSGPATRKWVEDIVRDTLDQPQPASAPVGEKIGYIDPRILTLMKGSRPGSGYTNCIKLEGAQSETDVALYAYAPPSAPVGVGWNVLTIGGIGSAYDAPNTYRAFTYDCQPRNVLASKLGRATKAAANASAGDSIDRGLGLLKALQEAGFGVFQIEPLAALAQQPAPVAPVGVDAYQPQPGEPPSWIDEWFIAKLDTGERVVLKRLPEEYSYDYTTADATYFMARRLKWWMQFPDSQFTQLEALAQQPAAVDEAMVERAFNAWCDVADVDEWLVRNAPEALRAALTAALAQPQGEG